MKVKKQFFEDYNINSTQYNYDNHLQKDYQLNNDKDNPSYQINLNENQSFFKRNILFISMFTMIVLAIIINNYDVSNFLKNQLNIDISIFTNSSLLYPHIIDSNIGNKNDEETFDFIQEFKRKYIYPNYWTLLILISSFAIFFFVFIIIHLKENQNSSIRNENEIEDKIKSNPYLIRQSNYQYEQYKDYYTMKEVEKLEQSEEYKDMKKQKGEDLMNWNWQIREKYNKVVYREQGTESEDISHLSLSD